MQMFNLRLRESICSTNKMMKEITVLDCENVKKFKFARIFVYRFLSILVSCQYNAVYIAPYHKQGRRSVFRIFLRKAHRKNSHFLCLLYSIFKLNVMVLQVVIYSALQPILALHIMNFSSCQNYWGGGAKRYVCPPPPYKYIYYFCRYIWGSCPPQYQKAGYASGGGGGALTVHDMMFRLYRAICIIWQRCDWQYCGLVLKHFFTMFNIKVKKYKSSSRENNKQLHFRIQATSWKQNGNLSHTKFAMHCGCRKCFESFRQFLMQHLVFYRMSFVIHELHSLISCANNNWAHAV